MARWITRVIITAAGGAVALHLAVLRLISPCKMPDALPPITAFCGALPSSQLACGVQDVAAMNSQTQAPSAPTMHNALGPLMFLIVPFVVVLAYGFLAQ